MLGDDKISTFQYFTKEQKEKAHNANIVHLLISQGERVKKSGTEYEWLDNGMKVTIRGNLWYHQYDHVGGDAIFFVMRFFNKSFPEAVQFLLDEDIGEIAPTIPKTVERKKFVLPAHDGDKNIVFDYLNHVRGINRDVITDFIDVGLIYSTTNKGCHNIVFVGTDSSGVPKHAHLRGTIGDFKGNVPGGMDEYAFHWNGTSNRIYLFEAPIDLLSYISLNKKEWKQHTYAAACGVSDKVLFQCLKDNPKLDTVYLCLDNDSAGVKATQRIKDKLKELNIKTKILVPISKDWNEDLIMLKKGDNAKWKQRMSLE